MQVQISAGERDFPCAFSEEACGVASGLGLGLVLGIGLAVLGWARPGQAQAEHYQRWTPESHSGWLQQGELGCWLVVGLWVVLGHWWPCGLEL